MKAAELFVRCLENEGVTTVYGIPGEENLDVMDALRESSIEFVTTRHEQGAAFMADVRGRLTGVAGVCLSTLGPGATNLVTGVADANMDGAPVVAIAGQAATTRLHKESHQVLDLQTLFSPITKYSAQIRSPRIVAEVVRKAFKVAQAEKPGVSFLEFPEDVAGMEVGDTLPLRRQAAMRCLPPPQKIEQAARLICEARKPIIMAGNGVVRAGAAEELVAFAERVNIPVATTFMAKGVIPGTHPLALGTVGLGANDYVACGFEKADLVICVGYDIVEYHPFLWNAEGHLKLIHVHESPAEVDECYIVEAGVVGRIGTALEAIGGRCRPHDAPMVPELHQAILDDIARHAESQAFPLKPQKIIWDLRQAMGVEDIVVSDVGAHKLWMARMYQAERPNTCIISNGFAAMGIAVPGGIAARHVCPSRKVVAVTGDAGFLMNSQEIETALRLRTPLVILIWNDSAYGLIRWKQMEYFDRETGVGFSNPDFVAYARSFGAQGYRIEKAADLAPTLAAALAADTVSVIDCPVDYSENLRLPHLAGDRICFE
ncbi:MAG: acetolactate synthase large subunit [Thermoleophilia bacterium]